MLTPGDDAAHPAFLLGGGVAGAALRGFDWTATGLGRPADWPPTLRSAVALCLHAAVPVAVFWGPELRVVFGDAWASLLGPRAWDALAQPARQALPDIWPLIGPQLRQAMTGSGVSAKEVAVPLAPGGQPGADTWWTYSLSPVLDSSGRQQGVLATVSDVTDTVLDRRRQEAILGLADRFAQLHDAEQIVRLGCEVIGTTLGAARVGRGIVDPATGSVSVSASWCDGLPNLDGSYDRAAFDERLTADAEPRAAVVDDVGADGRTAGRAALFRADGVGAFMTVPAVDDGQVRMLTFVHSTQPRRWRASDVGFVRDVVSRGRAAADRARAEVALRDSDERNRHSVALSPLFVWTARPDGVVDHVDGRLLELIGHAGPGGSPGGAPGGAPGGDWMQAVHPDDRAATGAAWAAAVAGGRLYDIEHRVRLAGEGPAPVYRWIRARANPQRDPTGRIVKWYGLSEDVDDARQAAALLASSEARLRAMTDSIDQMIWSARPDGSHDYFNQAWYDFTGLMEPAMEGWTALAHPNDRMRVGVAWADALATGAPCRIEFRLRHRGGGTRWVLGRASPVRGPHGQIDRWYGTCTDIQEIVDAREVLTRSRAELERLVADTAADRERMWRLSTDLMAILGTDGTVMAVNPAWERVLGWSPDELLEHGVSRLIHDDDVSIARLAMTGQAEAGPAGLFENRVRGKDGAYRVLTWTAVAENGMIHAIGRDNTAEREAAAKLDSAQASLRQAQKMEAVGQLTGGIAHDFNNMLAVVIGSLDLLGRRIDPADDRLVRHVANAMEGARRAASLTGRLLAFSRQHKLTPVTLDLRALLAGMTELLRSVLGASIRLELDHEPALWPILADHNQLENAILNLAVNARDAMPAGGSLRISAANAPADGVDASGAVDHVRLSVADTGEGVPAAVIDRVFDPFFTTKGVGKGTGLGLSQVYGFVTQSGGHVALDSPPGAGTTVTIHLPRQRPDQVHAATRPGLAPVPPHGRPWGTVLVVEDEADVRQFSAEAVTELGYRVLQADGGAAALAILDGPAEIRLLFTDIVMPDTDGRTLAVEALRRRPGLKVLFASGYQPGEPTDADDPVLSKPFTLAELAQAMRAALA